MNLYDFVIQRDSNRIHAEYLHNTRLALHLYELQQRDLQPGPELDDFMDLSDILIDLPYQLLLSDEKEMDRVEYPIQVATLIILN